MKGYWEYFVAFDEITNKSWFVTLVCALATFIIVLYTNIHFGDRNVWSSWEEDIEVIAPVYAETIHMTEFLRTHSNSVSNIFYMVVGFYATTAGLFDYFVHGTINDPKKSNNKPLNYLSRYPEMSILFGLGCFHLGLGSGLYHASLSKLGRQIDVASMYSPLLVFAAISIGRWYPVMKLSKSNIIPTWPLLAVISIVLAYIFYVYKWQMDSAIVLPTLIALAYGLALLDRRYSSYADRLMDLHWMGLSLLSLVLGFVCRVLDVLRLFPGSYPDSWWQGHAVWHLLTSAALYYMYLHHRSEPAISQAFSYSHLLNEVESGDAV